MSRPDRAEFRGVPSTRASFQCLAAILSVSIPALPVILLLAPNASDEDQLSWGEAILLIFYGFPMVVVAFAVGVIFARAAPRDVRPFLLAPNCALFFPRILLWVFAFTGLWYLGTRIANWRAARSRRPDFAAVDFGTMECRTCQREPNPLEADRPPTRDRRGNCLECGRSVEVGPAESG